MDRARVEEILGSVGGVLGLAWLWRWLTSREQRIASVAQSTAEVERARVDHDAVGDAAHVQVDHASAHDLVALLREERQRSYESRSAEMAAKVEASTWRAKFEALESDHAVCDGRIERLERIIARQAARIAADAGESGEGDT